jgi:L-serine dehydratase
MELVDYASLAELAEAARSRGLRIADVVLAQQAAELDLPPVTIRARLHRRLDVMRASVEKGVADASPSASGLCGGDAARVDRAAATGRLLGGPLQAALLRDAMAVNETNARMGRIVAAPTAGASGILPAVLFAVAAQEGWDDDALVDGLLTASGVGLVIAKRASLSGAEGGCQAECGSAAAMAAAALVELAGGTPEEALHAAAISLKNHLGLVCDPVAGLVEVPCVKRNAMGAVHAVAAADLALAGVRSRIPPDEVVDAMQSVGRLMSPDLKETARGGLAATPTGREHKRRIVHGE